MQLPVMCVYVMSWWSVGGPCSWSQVSVGDQLLFQGL